MRAIAVVALAAALSLSLAPSAESRSAATAKVAFTQGEQLVFFDRQGDTLEDALGALLAGPTARERTKGVTTEIPTASPLRSASVKGVTATIDLGERFALGVQSDSLNARLAQVVLTATQYPGVRYVRVLVKGGVPLGLFPRYPTSRALTRKDIVRPTVPPPGVGTEEPSGPSDGDTRALQTRLAELAYLDPSAVDGRDGEQTRFAVMAFQKWAGLDRDGVAGAKTLQALARAQRPTPLRSALGTRVEVLLDRQLALYVRDGQVVRVLPMSSGKPGFTTPSGEFQITRKEERSWSVPYEVWLPWASYFVGGVAFHESPDVPAGPASHGCVRLTRYDAEWLFRRVPVGMRVDVLSRST